MNINLMNIALVGYRGTGKSLVGRLLALELTWVTGSAWQFVDADVEIQRVEGRTIAEIFATDGEPYFREVESQVVREVVTLPQAVLSLGGGAILRAENREALQGTCHVVWLTATPETICERLREDEKSAQQRPRLTDLPAEEEVARLLEERQPLYRACAAAMVATDDLPPETVVGHIVQSVPPQYLNQG
ncbi:MAG: shikimate kinase [Pirellulaceae bacterium]